MADNRVFEEAEEEVAIDLDAALLPSSPSERRQRSSGGFGNWPVMGDGELMAEDDPTVVVRDFAYERPAAVSPVAEAADAAVAGGPAAGSEGEGGAVVEGGPAETSPHSDIPRNAGVLDTAFTFGSPSRPRQTPDADDAASPSPRRRAHLHSRNRTTISAPVPFSAAPAHAHDASIDTAPNMPDMSANQPVRSDSASSSDTAADNNQDTATDKPLTRAERRRLERRGAKADKDRAKALAGGSSSKIPVAKSATTTPPGNSAADSSVSSSATASSHLSAPSALPPVTEHRTARSYMQDATSAGAALSQALNKALLGRRNKSREDVSASGAALHPSHSGSSSASDSTKSKDKGKGKANASASSVSVATPTYAPVVDDTDAAALPAPFPSYGTDDARTLAHHSDDALPVINPARLGPYALPYALPFPSPAPAGVRRPDLVAETWRDAEEPERTLTIRERGVGQDGRILIPAWHRWICCCCEAETYWEFEICSRGWCCHKLCRDCVRVG